MGVMNAQNWKAVQGYKRITMEHYQLKHRLCLYGNMGKSFLKVHDQLRFDLQRLRRCWDRIFRGLKIMENEYNCLYT